MKKEKDRTILQAAVQELAKRVAVCNKLNVPVDENLTLDRVYEEMKGNLKLLQTNWEKPEGYAAVQRYSQYVSPIAEPTQVVKRVHSGSCIRCGKPRGNDGTNHKCRACADKENKSRNRSRRAYTAPRE